ncbi:ADP-ribose pyrophosphatase [Thermoflexales bacterium]|nr:ADP-ribose pyrophosphatase [Thermoflexales bacterium]
MEPIWIDWAKRLQAIAQTGLTYVDSPYDVERYEEVRRIAAEMAANRSDAELSRVLDLFSHDTGYATPKVDVRAVIFHHGSILLVRERSDSRWTLPGGWADVGEAPSECVVREAKEETGYDVQAQKLLAVYDRSLHPHEPPFSFHVYKLFFLCELVGGQATRNTEIDEIGFFTRDVIPPLSLTRITAQQIDRMFEHSLHPDWPTEFD